MSGAPVTKDELVQAIGESEGRLRADIGELHVEMKHELVQAIGESEGRLRGEIGESEGRLRADMASTTSGIRDEILTRH